MNHLTAYYQLKKLPKEVKVEWNIKSLARLDCVKYYNALAKEPLNQFVNNKGQLYFYSSAPENYVIANTKRISDIGLTHGSKNLSSIYIPNLDHIEYGFGDFDNHCLLFKLEPDLSCIEMFLIQNGKYLVSQFFQQFIDGKLDEEIEQVKMKAQPFFQYKD
jgi:hypothetical protein